MQHILAIFLILIISCSLAFGQCPTYISYSTQSEIDSFPIKHPNCSSLNHIWLNESITDPIINLQALNGIDSVYYTINILNQGQLESMEGLENIKHAKKLSINNCKSLSSLKPFQNCTFTESISIQNCESLHNLLGLENTVVLERDIKFENLASLNTLNGLNNLKSLDNLSIINCDSLNNVLALNQLEIIRFHLQIEDNDGIDTIKSFTNLTHVGGILKIYSNSSLKELFGFNNLTSVGQDVSLPEDVLTFDVLQNGGNSIIGFNSLKFENWRCEVKTSGITSINGFNSIERADIIIEYSDLTTVSGFSNLESSSQIRIVGNQHLTSIPLFNSLDSVSGTIEIDNNPILLLSSSFNSLASAELFKVLHNQLIDSIYLINLIGIDEIWIADNKSLKSISGLKYLEEIEEFRIISNDSLIILPNLEGIEFANRIEITDNNQLVNFPELSNLKKANNVLVSQCPNISTLNCCINIDTIVKSLTITLPNCTDIFGFNNLKFCGGISITCNKLQALPAFGSLIEVNTLSFSSNKAIDTLNIFNTLVTANSGITLSYNSCRVLTGFNSLINGKIKIQYNDSLCCILGFPILTTGGIEIRENISLLYIPSFNSLDSAIIISILINESLKVIDGFKNLKSLIDLEIRWNPSLSSVDGFNKLKKAERIKMDFSGAHSIPKFESLELLAEISPNHGGEGAPGISIHNMYELDTIVGFNNLRIITGDIKITGNDNLMLVNGFNYLDSIGGSLYIGSNNLKPWKMTGFNNLNSIGVKYEIVDNLVIIPNTENLTTIGLNSKNIFDGGLHIVAPIDSLSMFKKLKLLKGVLSIVATDINSLAGLETLIPNYISSITIQNNSNLTTCQQSFLCKLSLKPNFPCIIKNNSLGCNDCENIGCLTGLIQGSVFYDFNQNKIYDNDEFGIKSLGISVHPDNIKLLTMENGLFEFKGLLDQSYTISADLNSNFITTTDSLSYQVHLTLSQPKRDMLDFGLIHKKNTHSGMIYLTSSPTRCNKIVDFKLSYINTGSYVESGKVSIVIDSLTEFINSVPSATQVKGDTLVWEFSNLKSFENESITVALQMPDESFTGKYISMEPIIENNSQILSSFLYTSEIKCSYDPNDKLVFPSDSSGKNYFNQGQELFYMIRFQNDGNAEAIDIAIRDTIDQLLDMGSIRVIDASHNVRTAVIGNIVLFYFDNIWLPSFSIDEIGSQGFVLFGIHPKGLLDPGISIFNEAYIYFDQNDPIQTNVTLSTLALPTLVENYSPMLITIFPNPAINIIHIKSEEDIDNISVFSLEGILLFSSGGKALSLESLPAGQYVLKVRTTSGSISRLITVFN